jgi:DNA-binding CsgD family transcriptional regulator
MINQNMAFNLNVQEYYTPTSPSVMNLSLCHLTPREMDVLRYAAIGYTAKKIAIALGISYRTVETYIHSLKIKLNCASKADITEKAIQYGLLNLPTGI